MLEFFLDNTYCRIQDPHFYSACRLAGIPGLKPCNFYYVGQTRSKEGAIVDHKNRSSVIQWADDFKGMKIPIIFDNESEDICTTPWNNPNMDRNLEACHKFLDWYRQGDPTAEIGAWYAIPPATGGSCPPAEFIKLKERLRTFQMKLSFAVSELYQLGTLEEWKNNLRAHVTQLLEYDIRSIAVLCPTHQSTQQPLTVAELEAQVRMVNEAGYYGCLFWIGVDNPAHIHGQPSPSTVALLNSELLLSIERMVRTYGSGIGGYTSGVPVPQGRAFIIDGPTKDFVWPTEPKKFVSL